VGQALGDGGDIKAQGVAGGSGGQGIADIVQAGCRQGDYGLTTGRDQGKAAR